jgi:hypothetical protein
MAPNPHSPDSVESDRPYVPGTEVAVVDRRSSALERVDAKPTPVALIERAIDHNLPIEQLRALLDMHLELEDRQAKRDLAAALARFKAIAPPIVPLDGKVDFTSGKGRTSYRHATLAGFLSQLTGPMSECGLTVGWGDLKQTEKEITITCIVTHAGGASKTATLTVPIDDSPNNMNKMQRIKSSTSYARRATLEFVLGVGAGDMDDDGNMGSANGAAQPERGKEAPPRNQTSTSQPPSDSATKPAGPSKRAQDAIGRFAAYGIDQGAMERDLGMLAESWSEREYDLLKVAWVAITKAGPKEAVEARKDAARKVFHLGERTPGEDEGV